MPDQHEVGRSSHWRKLPPKPGSAKDLRIRCAEETMALMPDLITSLSTTPRDSTRITGPTALDATRSPGLPAATVRVINGDTLDVACSLIRSDVSTRPPAILNMASEKNPGGGWIRGAMAQEEAICYRSSLYMTLHKQFYPLKHVQAIYSPEIVIVRDSIDKGHKLLDLTTPDRLQRLAVISIAALRRPEVAKQTNASDGTVIEIYAHKRDEELMKMKMRVVLRVAGQEGHQCVVLGALGCGAFHNPKQEVMRLWKEVLEEAEWRGWFSDLVFAVLDTRNEGNFETFRDGLEGLSV